MKFNGPQSRKVMATASTWAGDNRRATDGLRSLAPHWMLLLQLLIQQMAAVTVKTRIRRQWPCSASIVEWEIFGRRSGSSICGRRVWPVNAICRHLFGHLANLFLLWFSATRFLLCLNETGRGKQRPLQTTKLEIWNMTISANNRFQKFHLDAAKRTQHVHNGSRILRKFSVEYVYLLWMKTFKQRNASPLLFTRLIPASLVSSDGFGRHSWTVVTK